MKNCRKRTIGFIGTLLVLCSALRAEQKCPGEIKVLLSPPSIQRVIAGFGLKQKAMGQVYLFDTENLDLMKQGVILRVRQGRADDLTVKLRWPAGSNEVATSRLRQHFPCELDRTGAGEDMSFSVGGKYKSRQVPETGQEIVMALSPSQKRLLREAGTSIDWSQVKRVASIKLTKWESGGAPSFGKLALELWESPGGNILELSTRVEPGSGASKYAELQRLIDQKGLPLSASQGTKTSMVLESLTNRESPLR